MILGTLVYFGIGAVVVLTLVLWDGGAAEMRQMRGRDWIGFFLIVGVAIAIWPAILIAVGGPDDD